MTPRQPVTLTSRMASGSSLAMGVAAIVFWVVAIHQAEFWKMGSFGLVSIMKWPFFVALGLVVIAISVELLRHSPRSTHLLALTVVLVLFLFGTASAVEPIAALYDSWLHAGFIQFIVQHGHALNGFDARFSWPGAFSLGAVMVAFTGQANALVFLRWFPLFIELLYLAPMLTIARFSGVGRRAGWLGVILFYATNWIYQDYFSPQGLNYLLFLVVIAVVLACWQPRRFPAPANVRSAFRERIDRSRLAFGRWRLGGHDAISVRNATTTLVILGLLALILLASAMSHQLTPYAVTVALAALLFTRRLGRPELIIVAALFAVGWLSLGASDYWVGHLSAIFGSVGKISNTIGSNVTSRIRGSASHRLVVNARILEVLVLYVLAGVGTLRRSPSSRALEALAFGPFLLLAAQNYGGEGLLRVVLFGLPFTALLAASAILPNAAGPIVPLLPNARLGPIGRAGPAVLRGVVAVALLGFSAATFVVRGGNDSFESFSTGELAAVNYVYDHAQAGQAIWLATPFMPIEYRDVGAITVQIAAYQGSSPTVKIELFTIFSNNAQWVILSKSEENWGVAVGGYPQGWITPFKASLLSGGYQVVARWPTASVLHLGPLP